MVNYNWNCVNVDVYVEQSGNADVVYKVHWTLTGSETVPDAEGNPVLYEANQIGVQLLDTSEIINFIPWDQVTEVEVEAWTKAAMGEQQVLAVETDIASQVALMITPVSISLMVGQPVPVIEQ
jgi:hypothetical protein